MVWIKRAGRSARIKPPVFPPPKKQNQPENPAGFFIARTVLYASEGCISPFIKALNFFSISGPGSSPLKSSTPSQPV